MSSAQAGVAAIERLREIMRRLRDPVSGCPWDREQDFESIAPYTIEEAYEVAAAIERGAPTPLRDELGDLLFQVVFHAQLAQERGWFNFDDIASAICDKLERRHPHVFGDTQIADAAAQTRAWEEHKARERASAANAESREVSDSSQLADVPLALPALARAAKLGKRAARVNFDWADANGVHEKVLEELAELDQARSSEEQREELGDLLFAAANWARHLGCDPEEALRQANNKFERRFRLIERIASERGLALDALTAAQWDSLWGEAKRLDSGRIQLQTSPV
jgi:nucleoside triphosphate diphosphatase